MTGASNGQINDATAPFAVAASSVSSINGESGAVILTSSGGTVYITTPTASTINLEAVGDGTGDVHGPASSTDNAIARYDGGTGKIIQDSGIILTDDGGVNLHGGYIFDDTDGTVKITGNIRMTSSSLLVNEGATINLGSDLNTNEKFLYGSSDHGAVKFGGGIAMGGTSIGMSGGSISGINQLSGNDAAIQFGDNIDLVGHYLTDTSSGTPKSIGIDILDGYLKSSFGTVNLGNDMSMNGHTLKTSGLDVQDTNIYSSFGSVNFGNTIYANYGLRGAVDLYGNNLSDSNNGYVTVYGGLRNTGGALDTYGNNLTDTNSGYVQMGVPLHADSYGVRGGVDLYGSYLSDSGGTITLANNISLNDHNLIVTGSAYITNGTEQLIDAYNRILMLPGNNTGIRWNNTGADSNAMLSWTMGKNAVFSQALDDTAEANSLDLNARKLYANDGSTTMLNYSASGHLNSPSLPSGTLASPPAGLNAGDIWMDTTTSATHPILRIQQ